MISGEVDQRPNVLVYGIGHSGTTLLTKMLHALGWNPGGEPSGTDEKYEEHIEFRECNAHALKHSTLPAVAAVHVKGLVAPWAIKDPRLVLTLPLWTDIFLRVLGQLPTLVWVSRDL